MIYLVTYSDSTMTRSKELCCESARRFGVDIVWPQSPDTISGEFKEFNSEILTQPRGNGYWLWKPYHIYKAMLKLKEGDTLVYADAGIEFVAPVREIIDRMDEDIFLFTNGFYQHEWCKRDVMRTIRSFGKPYVVGQPGPEIMVGAEPSDKQVQASVMFFKVNQNTKNFVKEWLLYCQMPGFIDDSPSKLPNHQTFAEHRHDQALITCLQIKHGYKLHFWPTNYSEHIRHTAQPGDTYPTMFNHHRKRNPGMGKGDVEW